jgi:hypothetical protein
MKTREERWAELLCQARQTKYLRYYWEYLALSGEVRAALPFRDYYTIKSGSQPEDLDEDLLKSLVREDEQKGQVDGELDMELTVHDEDVHEEVALELSYETSDSNTFDGQIDGQDDSTCDADIEDSSSHLSSGACKNQGILAPRYDVDMMLELVHPSSSTTESKHL